MPHSSPGAGRDLKRFGVDRRQLIACARRRDAVKAPGMTSKLDIGFLFGIAIATLLLGIAVSVRQITQKTSGGCY